MRYSWRLLAILFFFTFSDCAKKNSEVLQPDTPKPDSGQTTLNRGAVLENVASNIILPSYANYKVKLDSLAIESEAFTSNPDSASLARLRKAWEMAYIEWQKVELFDVGPAASYRLRNHCNIYPASSSTIESNMTNVGAVNFDDPANYAAQGFPCLDYLLFGQGTISETVTKYTTDANRVAYLKAVINKMNSLFTTVFSAWTGGYKNTFVSNTSLEIGSPMSDLVNGYVMNYERYLRTGKFGLPSGVMVTDGAIRPDLVEAFYNKKISLTLAKTAHQASVDFFNGKSVINGTEGPSFKTYLNELGAKDNKTGQLLSEALSNQFALSKSKMELLANNLAQEVQTNKPAVVAVFNELQTAVRMLKVDMTSAMSILITYADNDGD
jgi:hypothetical protein